MIGLFLIICLIEVSLQFVAETAAVAEATEIIGVIRIGVSLVDYIYKGKRNQYKNDAKQFEIAAFFPSPCSR